MLNVGTAQIHFFADLVNRPMLLRYEPNFVAQMAKGFVIEMLALGALLIHILRKLQ